MLSLILFAIVGTTGWVVSLLVWPFGPCHRCNGTGVNRGSSGKKFGVCRRCRGHKHIQRFGSRTVHKLVWTVLPAAVLAWHERQEAKAAERAEHPRHFIKK